VNIAWAYRGRKPKAPPFDFAQGRLSRKEREKWGTLPFGRKKKNFLDDLSNSVRLFDYVVRPGNRPARKWFPGTPFD